MCVELICTLSDFHPASASHVHWLDWEQDFALAQAFWPPDLPLTPEIWAEARDLGYHYCAIVEDGQIASIAAEYRCVDDAWMVAAVGTAPAFRRCGYAKAVVSFVTQGILDAGRVAFCQTREDNLPMIRTAESVGFRITKTMRG
ncbi:MAG: GNAT family N-acetyltransferase [Anaerolineae bacterium]|nr:GNAT family N-acetyltransferase [Anaerolineae bacterium]